VVVDAGADDFDGGGGPEGLHALFAPYSDALLVALQHGEDLDAAGAVVAVELGECSDRADVRGFVEDGDDGWFEASAGCLGEEFGDLEDAVDERGDDGCGGAGAFLGQQVDRGAPGAGGGEQVPQVELGRPLVVVGWVAPGVGWGDPAEQSLRGECLGGGAAVWKMLLVVTSAPDRVASRSAASMPAPALSRAAIASRRPGCSHATTSRSVPPLIAAASRVAVRTCSPAAWKNGSRRSPPMVAMKCPASRAAASTRSAGSASAMLRSGSHHQVCRAWAMRCGSNVHTGPACARIPEVRAHRSALLEVATTRTLGPTKWV